MFNADNLMFNKIAPAEIFKSRCAEMGAELNCEMLLKLVEESSEARYELIHNAPDTIKSDKTIWYVSGKGRKNALGNSPEDPFDSIESLDANSHKISAGDAVLFARGEEFRGHCITSISGVSYGAYGEGEKPIINASFRNYTNDNWYCIGDDIWTCDVSFPADVGNIIFDFGKNFGYKKIKLEDVTDYLDFYSDHDKGNQVFIKLKDNPTNLFKSIEIAYNIWMFRLEQNSDIIIENLSFINGGGHGIRGGNCNNIIVRGCEFRFIGGSYLEAFADGTVRYGNAIEFMTGSKNITVENCYVYEVYDSGATHQGLGYYCAKNIVFRNNLFSHCGMGSIEYWLGQGSVAKDVTYEGNILRFAGYGFGGKQRPDKNKTAHIQGNGFLHNHIENFIIRNNIFDKSSYDIINAQSRDETLPKMENNIYIQNNGERLGSWGIVVDIPADDRAEVIVSEKWNDSNAVVELVH